MVERGPRGLVRSGVVSNVWHGDLVGAERVPPAPAALLPAARHAVRLFRRCRHAEALVTSEGTMRPIGLAVYSLLSWVNRCRNLVLVEFLPGRKRGLSGAIMEAAYRALLGRACRGVQVMTAWERDEYRQRYGFGDDVVRHIPFYFIDDRIGWDPVPNAARRGVVSSGRNSCDWPTLIEAARDQGWDLTIVCSGSDRADIAESAAVAGIRLLSDLPRSEHDQLLAEAALFLVVLRDQGGSSGHVRLASAAARGTAAIVSAIPGIEGYDELAVQTVPPGDPAALRAAVNAALAEPQEVARREQAVLTRARRRPYQAYTEDIVSFLTDCSEPMKPRSTRRTTTT